MDRFEITDAPCQKNVDPEIFFPDPTDREGIAKAKEVCAKCASTSECLSFALKTNSYGVWGGMTDEDRKSYKRKMQRSSHV